MFEALEDFLIHCRVERRLAELTCRAYERDVTACLQFLRSAELGSLEDVRTADLRRFLAAEAERRPAPSSQARTVAALRCFFRFCVESEHLERDPAHVLRTPKKREALPDVLDRRELGRLLAVPGRAAVWKRLHAGKETRRGQAAGVGRAHVHPLTGATARWPSPPAYISLSEVTAR